VDPEPNRCRRTDGKKWRCGKSVVPGQKYCEKHMHRGRNRSRKPVETPQLNPPLATVETPQLNPPLATKPSSKSPTKPASNPAYGISNPNLTMAMQPSHTPSSILSRSLNIHNCSSMNRSIPSRSLNIHNCSSMNRSIPPRSLNIHNCSSMNKSIPPRSLNIHNCSSMKRSIPPRSLNIHNCSSMNMSKSLTAADYLPVFPSASAVSPGCALATAGPPKVAATFGTVASVAPDDKSCLKMFQKDNQSKRCVSNNTGNRSDGKGSIVGDSNGISTRISFSPTSVLQGNFF